MSCCSRNDKFIQIAKFIYFAAVLELDRFTYYNYTKWMKYMTD
jgi:hypothetical protein